MIYIRNETADILDMFDDMLAENGIKVPSPEDDEPHRQPAREGGAGSE